MTWQGKGGEEGGHKAHQWTTANTRVPLTRHFCTLGVRWQVSWKPTRNEGSMPEVVTFTNKHGLTVGAVGNSVSGNRKRCVKTEDEQHCIVSLPTWTGAMCLSNTCDVLTVNLYIEHLVKQVGPLQTKKKECIAKLIWKANVIWNKHKTASFVIQTWYERETNQVAGSRVQIQIRVYCWQAFTRTKRNQLDGCFCCWPLA